MSEEKKRKIVWGVAGVIVLIVVFLIGMFFGKGQTPSRSQGMQSFGQNGNGIANTRNVKIGGNFGGSTFGKIIAKDDKSITVQIISGGADAGTQIGSRIIFLGESTTISKQASAKISDLAIGTQVTVRGAANTDGSVNAQSIQIVPEIQKPTKTAPNMVQ
jgi:hypothetical protein